MCVRVCVDEGGFDLKLPAQLVAEGDDPEARDIRSIDQTWSYPTREQCMGCHTEAAHDSLGVEVGHLNFDVAYPSGATTNQLYTLWSIGMVDGDLWIKERHKLKTWCVVRNTMGNPRVDYAV